MLVVAESPYSGIIRWIMEEPTPLPPIPESSEPRHCPECGTRVANLATTCLMCGADLTAEPLAEDEQPSSDEEGRRWRIRIPWRGLVAGFFTAFAFVGLIGWLVRAQIVGPAPTATPLVTATYTPLPTSTSTSTPTPPPTPTFTPIPPQVHQVLAGETCSSVANAYGISLAALVDLNPEKCGPSGLILPSDLLLIPAATALPGPASTVGPGTPEPTAECPALHVVKAGETGLAIAEQWGISFSLVAQANPEVDFEQLQVNQVLQIPCGEPTPTSVPTVDPNATPTPEPKYAAPALLSPADGARITGDMVPLQWTAVSLLRDDEYYAVRLRRTDDSAPAESIYTRTTLVRLGEAYAPTQADPELEYSWEVTVVRLMSTSATGQPRYTASSFSSAMRSFVWESPTADATPEDTAGP